MIETITTTKQSSNNEEEKFVTSVESKTGAFAPFSSQ